MAPSEVVEFVHFSFYGYEDVRAISVKKITKPDLLDSKDASIPDGLYDLALGPINDTDVCKSCGQLSVRCSGHFGHIELARPIYHPLLCRYLKDLLEITCFYCHKFKLKEEKVERFVAQLDLIAKGDIAGARNLDALATCDSYVAGQQVDFTSEGSSTIENSSKIEIWSSLQNSEAASVLLKFMKERRNECSHCKGRNPKIKYHTVGWFNKEMSRSDMHANVINDFELLGEDSLRDDGSSVTDDESSISVSKHESNFSAGNTDLLPSEVEVILESLWKHEMRMCKYLCQIHCDGSSQPGIKRFCSMFLLKALLVPPCRFRPPARSASGGVLEHPQTALLCKVQEANIALRESSASAHVNSWRDLQMKINILFDSAKGLGRKDREIPGIRQLLEKKGGILRQKMMGKRVNYAARSVISPDPYLGVNEIGIPPFIALKLTYPERVTPLNVAELTMAVLNGAGRHPGATSYEDRGNITSLNRKSDTLVVMARKLPAQRVCTQPNGGLESEFDGKTVCRHLRDGDLVIVNRQPTLHKPSMMAHIVRVLYGEKTIRMHYANCSTYNADFDGDEMNIHLPQDDISRSEAINIVNANKQYIVPTSGEPIRGLIQDHIVSAVLLTKKDTFLTREDYNQLLYASCVPARVNHSKIGKSGKVSIQHSVNDIQPLLPAILKPTPLWTGKQVISAILHHLTENQEPFTVEKDGKIPKEHLGEGLPKDKKISMEHFSEHLSERKLCILKNDFIRGILDKNQYGQYGLVHTVHELYGADVAGTLLSSFSRLFTFFLQMHGFTCGVDDLMIDQRADMKRKRILESSEEESKAAHCKVLSLERIENPTHLQKQIEKYLRCNGDTATARLDRVVSGSMNVITSKANEKLFPRGLVKPFFSNCLSLMTSTGAKGGLVNTTQISSLLGQQELEGKRVPRMASGKTLPCFSPWDMSPRAGGFISDRFLTGLRPQEYYFHCMAGREGLVDTAVKTSRSGYLQRCLMKNLECLKVCYDLTVRDADGSVVQFMYGEDGVDVLKNSFLSAFGLLSANKNVFLERLSGQFEHARLSKSNSYIKNLPLKLKEDATKFINNLPKNMQDPPQRIRRKELLNLLELKYLSSLAEPGEAVGVIAAQSVGEPSTQMTLNTFHLAGKGEMNVTLGIPRLQEIFTSAKENIRTPVMTCPFHNFVSEEEATCLANKFERISVADITESLEVCALPLAIHKDNMGRDKMVALFKLRIKLRLPDKDTEDPIISVDIIKDIMMGNFIVVLKDTIKKHMVTVKNINLGKYDPAKEEESTPKVGPEDDEAQDKSNIGQDDDDIDGENDDEDADGGTDATKRKSQKNDEMEYDDEHDGELISGSESEVDQEADKDDNVEEESREFENLGIPNDAAEMQPPEDNGNYKSRKSATMMARPSGSIKKKKKEEEDERVIYSNLEGSMFEAHIIFENEPHILLDKIALKAAKNVFVRASKDLERCTVVAPDKDTEPFRLQSAGVNFQAFWDMEDFLDIDKLRSNNVLAMLNTYGVEAARATLIEEVKGVFKAYGIRVDLRHLSLIADFMTAGGFYRPMNRLGMATSSTSTFSRMTFETATLVAMEAAQHGELDTMESPSASVCVGRPVRMGTGCFDVLQKLQL